MADLFTDPIGSIFDRKEYGAAYRYLVTVNNLSPKGDFIDGALGAIDTFAQEFSGVTFPSKTIKTKRVPNLGPKDRKVITGVSYSNMVLKRGLVRENTFYEWVKSTEESITSASSVTEWRQVIIQCLSHNNLPLAEWKATIRPEVYTVSELGSQKEEVVIESITFAVDSFSRI